MGKLLAFSLTISLIGIFILLILTIQNPTELTGKSVANDYVNVSGKIISIKNYQEFSIITLENNISVVCFKCNFKANDFIEVEGTLSEYNKKIQINAEKIIKIK